MATAAMSGGQSYGRHQRPSSAKLAGVKFELYHPALPTLRRMSMDDVTHKLPPEHSRTSTPCSRGDFTTVRTTLKRRGWSDPNLPCQTVLSKQVAVKLQSTQDIKTRSFTENWKAILSSMKTHTSSKSTAKQDHTRTQTDPLQLKILGLAPRTAHPDVTGAWQNNPNRPMSAEWCRPPPQRQMPANMYTRYRSLSMRARSANPWK